MIALLHCLRASNQQMRKLASLPQSTVYGTNVTQVTNSFSAPTNWLTPKIKFIDSYFSSSSSSSHFFSPSSFETFFFVFLNQKKRQQQWNRDHIYTWEGDHDKSNWWFHLHAQLFRKIHYSNTLKLLLSFAFNLNLPHGVVRISRDMSLRTCFVIGCFISALNGLPMPQERSSESPGDWCVRCKSN